LHPAACVPAVLAAWLQAPAVLPLLSEKPHRCSAGTQGCSALGWMRLPPRFLPQQEGDPIGA